MKLSNQAVGAIMMALQKGIMDQEDITGLLRDFELSVNKDSEVMVVNPPTLSLEEKQWAQKIKKLVRQPKKASKRIEKFSRRCKRKPPQRILK